MKFGKNFLGRQVPEWQQYYISYKSLKKQIKLIVSAQDKLRNKHEVDSKANNNNYNESDTTPQFASNIDILNSPQVKTELASFFFILDRNIEKVDEFYNKQYTEYQRRLKRISAVLNLNSNSNDKNGNGIMVNNSQNCTSGSPHGSVISVVFQDEEETEELIGILLELRNGFRNLKWFGELNRRGFRKILKKLDKKSGTSQMNAYLNARVYPLGFSNEGEILKDLGIINDYLNLLSDCSSLSIATRDPNKGNSDHQLDNYASTLEPPSSAYVSSGKSRNTPKVGSLNKTHSSLDTYLEFIYNDDVEGLDKALIGTYMSPVLAPLKLLLGLLNKATMNLSYSCIDWLLDTIPVLSDTTDISGRNFLHHHVIALGKRSVSITNQGESTVSGSSSKANIVPANVTTPGQEPTHINYRLLNTLGPDGINSNDNSQGLLYIFNHLPAHLKFSIVQKDNYKRTPLHYAAQYGLKQVTAIILEFLQRWGLINNGNTSGSGSMGISLDDISHWGDSELLTPIHLAILGTHPKTTQVLLDAMPATVTLTCPSLALLATRLNCPEILALLFKKIEDVEQKGRGGGISIDYADPESKETSLYIASKLNYVDCVSFLLEQGANTELGELTFGWTPIFVAAAEGFIDVVKVLVQHGAKFDVLDESGWFPREHAALRGHLKITELLTPSDFNPYDSLNIDGKSKTDSNLNSPHTVSNATSVEKLPSATSKFGSSKHSEAIKHLKTQQQQQQQTKPAAVKSFGHRYLQSDESLILLTLGTTDTRVANPAIELNRVPISKVHATELDTALSLHISAKCPRHSQHSSDLFNNSSSDLTDSYMLGDVLLDLPLDDNHGGATDPITFSCSGADYDVDPLDTIVYFDVVPTYQFGDNGKNTLNSSDNAGNQNANSNKILGRAVAVLRNVYTGVGMNKSSLSNSIVVPILEQSSLEVLGTIRFEFLLVTPFTHPKMMFNRTDTYWKSLVSSRVIGHRGNGMNSRDRRSLQLGENTVESFIAAASLGASYVEFDVQLTKDDIPVVYHDFLVAEAGVDVPMHALTLEQFLGLNNIEDTSTGYHHNGKEKLKMTGQSKDDTFIYKKQRFLSHDEKINNTAYASDSGSFSNLLDVSPVLSPPSSTSDIFYDYDHHPSQERMKLTRTWKTKQYKGNSRGSSIASSFVTLVDLFRRNDFGVSIFKSLGRYGIENSL
ncbi:unnamed protein product [Ambrosiozyma monospora]|uniref:Unnamed protein product n=1 Tax=Ambrosiozyma monospora TaxID=43982 RepID=A0A9W7DFQ4_AMBMO|nr:unnamed protein product [Ambrosiozyma monospora]